MRLSSRFIVCVVAVFAAVATNAADQADPQTSARRPDPGSWGFHPGNPLMKTDAKLLDGLLNDPAVLKTDVGYEMYYGAIKGDFSDGNTVRTFRATSKDGVRWERNSVPVLEPGPPGSWESVKVESPSILKLPGGRYRLYYAGSNRPDSEAGFQIGFAESDDGVAWTKHPGNPVLRLDPAGGEVSLLGQSVVYKGGEFWLWYPILSKEFKPDIRLAKSRDGVTWEKKGVVVSLDRERVSPTDLGVMEADVIWNGREFEMFYDVLRDGGIFTSTIWHAVSTDGVHWTKDPAPVLDTGPKDSWIGTGIHSPTVVLEKDRYRMWFGGTHTDRATFLELGIGLAEKRISTD